jgi:PAS domain S-box-containing protein
MDHQLSPAEGSGDPRAELGPVFEQSGAAMLVTDDQRRILAANAAACRLIGAPRGELVGRRVDELTGPDDCWERLRTGLETAGEWSLRRPDGVRLRVSYTATPNFIARRHLITLLVSAERDEPAGPGESLSEREREVLRCVSAGLSSEEIAVRLVISAATVRSHVENAMRKLGARTRAQAVAIALRERAI